MCMECEWDVFLDEMEEWMDEDKYKFAEDTLTDIYSWVEENQHVTERQRKAVENIRKSV